MSGVLAQIEIATGGLWPYLVVVFIGFLPSEIWRWLSVFLVRGLADDSEILVLVRAIAVALLAAVAAKLMFAPPGALASLSPLVRWSALAGGVGAFFAFRQSIPAGVIAGEALLIAGGWLIG